MSSTFSRAVNPISIHISFSAVFLVCFCIQVHFSPLWICSPLSESEFKGAIIENYFSRMKFKFGLSENQVRRLLQLFSTRRQSSLLPSRQLLKESPTSADKVRRQVGLVRSSANERLEMEYGLEAFTPSAEHLLIDDALDDEGNEAIVGQGFTPHYTDTSINKNRRVNYKSSGPDLYRSFDNFLDSRTDSLDFYNEQMPARYPNFFRSGNAESDFDVSSPDPATGLKFSRDPMDCAKSAQWPYLDGKGWPPYEDMSRVAEGMQPGPDHGSFLANRRDNVNMQDVSYEGDKSLGLSLEDKYVRLGLMSNKFGTPLDEEQRLMGEQMLSSRDNFMKGNYIDYHNRSTTMNASSALGTGIENHSDDYSFQRRTVVNELDMGNVTRADISNKYNDFARPYCSPPECLNMSCSDVKFSDSNLCLSTSHDGIVRRSVPESPSVRHGRSSPVIVGHSTSSAKDINCHPSECNYQALSRNKTFEADGSSRVYVSDVGNKVPGRVFPKYVDCPTAGISDRISVKSAAAAEYRSAQFSPSAFVRTSLNNEIPIARHHYGVSPAVQTYISSQKPEEMVNYHGTQSPAENFTDLDIRNQEYDPGNHEMEGYDISDPCMKNNDHWFRSREGVRTDHSDSGNRRKSVFSRLTSTSSICPRNDEENDIDMYIESSVNEVMEILRHSQKSNLKRQKRIKPPVQRFDERDMKKVTLVSSVKSTGKSDLKLVQEKINEESSKASDGCINETLTETRAVEFGRRGNKKRSISEKTGCTDLKNKDGKRAENAEREVPLSKQPKRRKLVRPAFGLSKVVCGSGMDKESLSSPQPTEM